MSRRIEVVHWNPVNKRYTMGKRRFLPYRPRLGNFGDLLGPVVARHLVREFDVRVESRPRRLAAVGSVLHLCRSGDIVWGTGLNGKHQDIAPATGLEIRAVRGPLTRDFLRDHGYEVPEVYGDPGLLLPRVLPLAPRATDAGTTVIPNLNDLPRFEGTAGLVSPLTPWATVAGAIADSSFVTGTSLHAAVLADAYGVPHRLIRSANEPSVKYEDYYLGTGRASLPEFASSIDDAVERGPVPSPQWSEEPLLAAFPRRISTRESPMRDR